ncbi:hypothetical protein SAMN02745181_2861 [Rubritalea squalenifaciens DSM 18772]|uniref:Peptidase inhibitor I78 family protein n=1 Tax=Rubritalea squalenifaciens DSM 18772 TaxID=1123071 RepID=A0A1M6NHZ2_9BACT|nr:hypothetical protein [Rubritalea squalenifaciens]SHJ95290.1 hypothetical protein SAMN02745181_2861 [Rubritalea squalenifaciens DSM 18772]
MMKHVVFALAGLSLFTSCSRVDEEKAVKKSAEPGAQKQPGETKKMAEKKAESETDESLKSAKSEPKGDDRYLGMELKAAMELAKSEGRSARVIQEDGEHRIVTRDYRPERLNFVVVKGKVTEVTRG